jgi:hypothetical protein
MRLLAALTMASLLMLGGLPAPLGKAAGPSPTTTATTFISQLARGEYAAAERSFSPTMQAAAPRHK